MRIAFTFNLKRKGYGLSDDANAEFDNPETIEAIRNALEKAGNEVILIEGDEHAYERLKSCNADIVFNWAEGLRGESRESQIPAMLEMLGMPYVGSGPLALALALDKARAKEVASFHDIPTAKFQVFNSPDSTLKLAFPLIVKPLHEGSSKGVRDDSVVRSEKELRNVVARVIKLYRQPAIAEEFLDGREFTVSIFGNKNPIVLPLLEKNFSSLPKGATPIDSWDANYVWNTKENPIDLAVCPAKVTPVLKSKIVDVALRTFKAFQCCDWCRVDVRMKSKSDEVYLLELNPIPGLLPKPEDLSYLPLAGWAAGLTYEEIVNAPVYFALERYGMLHKAGEYYSKLGKKLEGVSRITAVEA